MAGHDVLNRNSNVPEMLSRCFNCIQFHQMVDATTAGFQILQILDRVAYLGTVSIHNSRQPRLFRTPAGSPNMHGLVHQRLKKRQARLSAVADTAPVAAAIDLTLTRSPARTQKHSSIRKCAQGEPSHGFVCTGSVEFHCRSVLDVSQHPRELTVELKTKQKTYPQPTKT